MTLELARGVPDIMKGVMNRRSLAGWIFSLLLPISLQADPSPSLKIGDKAPPFTLTDIRFAPRTLQDLGPHTAFAIAFTDARCPVAAKYLPRLEALWKEYRERGVLFLAINSSPDDDVLQVAADALEKRLTFPVYKDFDQSALRSLGARRTPEVVLLDGSHALRYRGQIDDQFLVSGERPSASRSYLREALESVLAGKSPEVEETPVNGCIITLRHEPALNDVTYSEHIAPILQKNCQICHRPNRPAPFSLLTYEDAAARADMIREVVEERRMPPSFQDPRHGRFINHQALSREEIEAVAGWAASGAPRGDPKKLPPPRDWPKDAWDIGEPDLVLPIPSEIRVPPTGYVDYKNIKLDHEFRHDTWVNAIQIVPGNHRVVHHANLYVSHPSVASGEYLLITGYVPGGDPTVYGKNSGILLKKGSKLRLQIHYTTTGKEERDQTRVGIVYAKEMIRKPTKCMFLINFGFKIPPFDPAYEVRMKSTFSRPAVGVGLYVHMHLRGKDMTFVAHYPDGTEEKLLSVPNYNFDWQLGYRWPQAVKRFPPGTLIETISHYDNSPYNPFNPDPTQSVGHGQQTYQEMNYGFLFYQDEDEDLRIEVDPRTGRPLTGEF